MSPLNFLLQYVRRPREIGAVAPSSKALAHAMLTPIDWQQVRTIAEFGPGTGVMTHQILKRMRQDAKLTTFEVNEDFCQELEHIDDDRLTVRAQSAEKLDFQADAIISSLPMNAFPIRKKMRILNAAVKHLAPEGRFVQFQYTTNLEPLLESYFIHVQRRWIPINLPPAFVYVCRKSMR